MLKDILFFIFLFLGIFVSQKNIILGIIYSFSLLLFRNKNNEYFQTESCNYNIPLYVNENTPIVINIEEYELCVPDGENEEEELNYIPIEESSLIITGSSTKRTITFSHPIPSLKNIFKGENVQFSGSIIDRETTYTVAEQPTTTTITLNESIPNFKLNKGTFIIMFPSINENLKSIVYHKSLLETNINDIDDRITDNKELLSIMDKSRHNINTYLNIILLLRKSIRNKTNQININSGKIVKNDNIISNRADYINFLGRAVNQGLILDEEYQNSFSDKYNKLKLENFELNRKNDRLNLSILEDKNKIRDYENLICKDQQIIDDLLKKFPENDLLIALNNAFIEIQNSNFNKFVNGCKVPPAPSIIPNHKKQHCIPNK